MTGSAGNLLELTGQFLCPHNLFYPARFAVLTFESERQQWRFCLHYLLSKVLYLFIYLFI